ncbi:MAG: hypothetical protein N2512_06565 [Armatimonadetes bacterium]|nr:hypothetical protein [Armatimonadota bacterium]
MKLGDNPDFRRLAGGGGSGQSKPPPRSPSAGGQQRPQGASQQRPQAGGGQQPPRELPAKFVLDSFYGPDGKLRQELFYDLPRELAKELARAGVSSKGLRSVFVAFQSFAGPLQAGRLDFPTAKERFNKMYVERVARQVGRGMLPHLLQDFFDRHRDLALAAPREMLGLFEYLKNVFCYMPDR